MLIGVDSLPNTLDTPFRPEPSRLGTLNQNDISNTMLFVLR